MTQIESHTVSSRAKIGHEWWSGHLWNGSSALVELHRMRKEWLFFSSRVIDSDFGGTGAIEWSQNIATHYPVREFLSPIRNKSAT